MAISGRKRTAPNADSEFTAIGGKRTEYQTSFLTRTAEQVLNEGVTVAYAAAILKTHDIDLKILMDKADIQPTGRFANTNLYSLNELASLVVAPRWSEEEWEDILSRRHFPSQLVKEFWGAKKARQDFLLSASELWETEEVISAIGDIFKTISMGIRLITDNIDRETSLTPTQRELLNQYVDSSLNSAAKSVQDKFSGRVKAERIRRFEKLTGEVIRDGRSKANKNQDNAGKAKRIEQTKEEGHITLDIASL